MLSYLSEKLQTHSCRIQRGRVTLPLSSVLTVVQTALTGYHYVSYASQQLTTSLIQAIDSPLPCSSKLTPVLCRLSSLKQEATGHHYTLYSSQQLTTSLIEATPSLHRSLSLSALGRRSQFHPLEYSTSLLISYKKVLLVYLCMTTHVTDTNTSLKLLLLRDP